MILRKEWIIYEARARNLMIYPLILLQKFAVIVEFTGDFRGFR